MVLRLGPLRSSSVGRLVSEDSNIYMYMQFGESPVEYSVAYITMHAFHFPQTRDSADYIYTDYTGIYCIIRGSLSNVL